MINVITNTIKIPLGFGALFRKSKIAQHGASSGGERSTLDIKLLEIHT